MPRRQTRNRRVASSRQLKVYRALGWRYSQRREAWVHRLGGGEVGPVFVEHQIHESGGVIDDHLYRAMTRRKPPVVVPEEERTPLPRRVPGGVRTEAPEAERPIIPVEVALRADEPPRVVLVDGRPPVRGTDPRALTDRDGVVVPITKARATA